MKSTLINSENERYYVRKMISDIQNEIQIKTQGKNAFLNNSLGLKEQFSIEDYSTVVNDRITAVRRQDRIDTLKSSLNSPYFGRMDVFQITSEEGTRVIGSDKIIYIGYEELSAKTSNSGIRTLVYSWKSDWGELFNRSSEQHDQKLEVSQYVGYHDSYLTTYEVSSKVGVNIEKRKYRSHQIKYLRDSDELEQTEIQDPFLQLVLKERLNHHQPVDIIRSIQHKQNEIIWASPDEDILVEGCAGSGKTMVLLHRLSVWDYRRKILGKNCYFIIPEKELKDSLSDLVTKLKLEKLNILTVPELYKTLIEKISSESLQSPIFDSDFLVDHRILNEIYNDLDFDSLNELVFSEVSLQLNHIKQKTITEYLNKIGISIPEFDQNNLPLSIYNVDQILRELANEGTVLKNKIQKIKNKVDLTVKQVNRLEKSREYQFLNNEKCIRSSFLKQYIDAELRYLKYLQEKFEYGYGRKELYKHTYATGLQSDLIQLRSSYLSEIPSSYPQGIPLSKKSEKIKKLYSKRHELDLLIKLYEDGNLNSFPFDKFRMHQPVYQIPYTKYKPFLDMGDSKLFKLIRELILKSNYLAKLNQALNIHLKATPKLNDQKERDLYLKKSKAYKKDMLKKIDIAFREEKMIEEEITRLCSQKFKTINESRIRLQQYDEMIEHLKKEILVAKLFDSTLFLRYLSEEEYSDLTKIVPDLIDTLETISLDDSGFFNIDDNKTDIILLEPLIQVLKDLLPKFESDLDKINNKILTYKEELKLLKAKESELVQKIEFFKSEESENNKLRLYEIRNNLSVENLTKSIFNRLCVSANQDSIDKSVLQPCKLFLGLRIAMIRRPDFNKIDAGLICIDEIQDFSIKELEILKSIFAPNSNWNFFGDLMQSTYSFKKINNWREIIQLINCKKFVLNENYRNPVNVTDYCNLNLNMNMIPLGLTGKTVQVLNRDEFRTVLADDDSVSQKPVCIFSTSEMLKEFSDKFNEFNLKMYLVNEVKGQEFKNVAVIDGDMNRKEKYLAYSRTLENLYIINY